MSDLLWSIWNCGSKAGNCQAVSGRVDAADLCWAPRLLALRAFRENYLKVWVLGWAAWSPPRCPEHRFARQNSGAIRSCWPCRPPLSSPSDFSPARFCSIRAMRDLILPLMVITPVLVGFAGARVLLWPDSLPLRMALRSRLSRRFADGRDRSVARAPWTLAACSLAGGFVAAGAASFLASFHRSLAAGRF